MSETVESIDERLDYLGPERTREVLGRVIESLIANGDAVAASDILCENCLLTFEEARKIYAEFHRRKP